MHFIFVQPTPFLAPVKRGSPAQVAAEDSFIAEWSDDEGGEEMGEEGESEVRNAESLSSGYCCSPLYRKFVSPYKGCVLYNEVLPIIVVALVVTFTFL